MSDSENEWQLKFLQLKAKIKTMRDLQKEYFRKRDPQVLLKSKQCEREVDEIITPKPTSQATLDWLGQ